ncbi:MAG: ABC transporter ATP-binding protein [Lachnospira sp.]
MKIEVNGYSKKIKGNMILDDITLELESGKIYGLRGTNGSGKTMLMRAIAGLILPNRGNVSIDGIVLGKEKSFPDNMGLLLEYPSFVNSYTGFRNLKMIASINKKINDEKISETIKRVGLDPDDKRSFRKYSLGMKQKLGIACAIMEDPELLILDEPFNALDAKGCDMVRAILNEFRDDNKLVILACHDKSELETIADEIFEIYEGKVTEHIVMKG